MNQTTNGKFLLSAQTKINDENDDADQGVRKYAAGAKNEQAMNRWIVTRREG
jgi:hypothetical protein